MAMLFPVISALLACAAVSTGGLSDDPPPPLPPLPPIPPATTPAAGPITNAALQRLMTACNQQVNTAVAQGKDYAQAMTAAAGDLLGKVDVPSLTTEQFEMLLGAVILRNIPQPLHAPVMRQLGILAADRTALGARAAIVRLTLIGCEPDPSEQRLIIDGALRHPGYRAALESGLAAEGINCTQAVPYAMVGHTVPLIADLADVLPDELGPINSWQTSYLMDMVLGAKIDPPLAPERIRKLRDKCLTIQKNALAKLDKQIAAQSPPVTGAGQADTRNRLAANIRYLEGAYARGELVGFPAPEITFVWSSGDSRLTKLSDLRGKVVVLDFWATWCGPCRMSIPRVAALVEHYKDKPVAIIGITHPQGFHIDQNNKRIDTRGQPEREFTLMAEMLAPMKIHWPQAFTADSAANAEYGVRSIPHMVIIDAKGIVRHRGLNPLVPMEEKIMLIDPLLAEVSKQ
ncbi:MAG: TlpA family protein disulfide reductase [Phycisphaerales bacterium]|nr:TlpA family protein disulfide reductase [Phycisphaerales bacterium]